MQRIRENRQTVRPEAANNLYDCEGNIQERSKPNPLLTIRHSLKYVLDLIKTYPEQTKQRKNGIGINGFGGLKFNPKFINGTVAALIFKLKVLEGYHQNLQKTNILEA